MSSNALYQEVYQNLSDAIRSGEYIENEPLPSERYLSEKYQVSRSTIRLALNLLKENDYIYTVPGNGSFIKPQSFELHLNKLYSFTDELKENNLLIYNNIIDYSLISLDKPLAKKLGHPVGATFHKLVRLRSEEFYPLMLETTFLPKSRIHHLDIAFLEGHGSLYQYLASKYEFHAEQATETFCPILANSHERELLKIAPNTPCMLLERYSYEDDSIIEYTRSVVRGDKYTFRVDLTP